MFAAVLQICLLCTSCRLQWERATAQARRLALCWVHKTCLVKHNVLKDGAKLDGVENVRLILLRAEQGVHEMSKPNMILGNRTRVDGSVWWHRRRSKMQQNWAAGVQPPGRSLLALAGAGACTPRATLPQLQHAAVPFSRRRRLPALTSLSPMALA